MCSLSNSMATFKIHEDDENSYPTLSAKLKDLGPIQQKRTALGEVDKNVFDPSLRILKDKAAGSKDNGKATAKPRAVLGDIKPQENAVSQITKKDFPRKEKSVEIALESSNEVLKSTENSANIGVKVTSLVDNVQLKQTVIDKPHRSPLKELDNFDNDSSSRKVSSPMVVDDSPITKPAALPKSIKLQLEDLYACVTYKDDIFKYLMHRETVFKPKPQYMKRQPDVTYAMRTILVDWLVEVGEEYKLSHPTLFLTVSFVDRFLSSMAVVRNKLQLLGTAAMFLASKFEEIYPPDVGEFTYITDDSYTKKQVLRMENLIAKVLDFNLSTPTSYTFLMHIVASLRLPDKVMFLAMYICELSLLEADPYLEHLPSLIACGAIALARHCLGYVDVWPVCLSDSTGYSLKQLAPVVNCLNDTHAKSFTVTQQQAMKEKYKAPKYQRVSAIPHKKLSLRMDA
uniref:Cyclin-A1 n=1 Tax=Lygus hesperus TaxID=30085 RepID=A0A0A9W0G1_LYGHE